MCSVVLLANLHGYILVQLMYLVPLTCEMSWTHRYKIHDIDKKKKENQSKKKKWYWQFGVCVIYTVV